MFGSFHKRAFAYGMKHLGPAHNRMVGDQKRRLIAPLEGELLEIGSGAGANLPYYQAASRLVAIDPNPYMHVYLRREAQRLGVAVETQLGTADRLPFADRTLDAVVSTLVLCSVPDVAAALAEIRRVLRDGGRFVFIEHVAAERGSGLRSVQGAVGRCWRWVCDGCHPDRDTLGAIERAGFSRVEAEAFRTPIPVVAPHIAGFAVR